MLNNQSPFITRVRVLVFPDAGTESRSPALQADSLPSQPQEKPSFSAEQLKDKHQIVMYPWKRNQGSILSLNYCCPIFVLGGSKITADGDCSHEIKRHLLLGRKAMTNLDRILKSRDITLSTKVHLVKAIVFPVVVHGGENWTIKNAECQKIYAFELWCQRRLLRAPWTARRSNQS